MYIEKSQNIRIGTHFLQYRYPFCWIILLSAIYRDLNSVIGTPFCWKILLSAVYRNPNSVIGTPFL